MIQLTEPGLNSELISATRAEEGRNLDHNDSSQIIKNSIDESRDRYT